MKFKTKPQIVKDHEKENVLKEELAQKFLLGATINDTEENTSTEKPIKKKWEEIEINKKTIVFNFRIPKKDMQQLKYISQERKISLNALCLMAIQEQNKKFLKDLENSF